MMREEYEIRNALAENVEECPQCGGEIRKFKDWKLRCNACDLEIYIETKKQRMYFWIFNGVCFAFICGLLLATVI